MTQPLKKSGKASVAGATLLAVAAAVCHAEQPDQAGSRAGDPPADDDYVVLPPIVVTPNESFDPWFNYDRSLRAIQRSLPGLDTDRPRKRDLSERFIEGLGLTGEGVHGLHPAEQARLEALLETVNGDPRP